MDKEHVGHEPLIRMSKRGELLPAWKAWGIRVIAFFLSLVVSGIVIVAISKLNPAAVFATMLDGAIGSNKRMWVTVRDAMTLLCIAVGLAPAFKMRFWNIGAEGQILVGAIASAACMIYLKNLPTVLLLAVMIVASLLAGGLWGFFPGLFKARWNTNETLFTLMMNYIAIGIVKWLQGGPWEGKPGSQIIPNFAKSAYLPSIFGVHIGWIVVLVLVVVLFVYLKFTKHGYEIAVLGESENTARYAGMNVRRITVRTAFLSGAIAGLVGFLVVSGADHTLADGVAAGVGFTAITVCWLAQLNPFAMIAISLLLSTLSKGAATLQTKMNIPTSLSDIITAVILLCMLGCEFFINYRLITRGHHEKEVR